MIRRTTTGPYPAKGIAVSACALMLAVSGCSGGSSGTSAPSAMTQTNDISQLVHVNEQPRDALETGGTLRLAVGALGPNFNVLSNAGNNDDTITATQPMDNTGCFISAPDGSMKPNKDYCESVTEKVEGGKQTITYVMNPKANFNDGTPMDVKMFQNMWKVLNGSNPAFSVVSTQGYDQIADVKQGKDAREVIVTMKKVYEPYTDLFNEFLHPAVNTPDLFNKAFVGKIHPEWHAGPFTVGEYDEAKQTLTLVQNPKWWGTKPLLDKILWSAVSSSASLPAFKNGELDATGAATASRLQQLQSTPDVDFRRGQRTASCGFLFNTKQPELKDVAVRKAIYQTINRQQLVDIETKGLNYTAKLPGSWQLLPISPYYQDNYPVKDSDAAGAAETLKSAGYTQGSDKMFSKNGQKVSVSITNFGDDPTFNAVVQAFQKQLTTAGIDAKIDQRPDSAFNDAMDKRDFAINFMCYGVGPDATGATGQYYSSTSQGNMTGCGSKDIDGLIEKVPEIVDPKERNKAAMDVEKKWQSTCYAMLPYVNGPRITAANKYLSGWGPGLFRTIDWVNIGWMKGHKKA